MKSGNKLSNSASINGLNAAFLYSADTAMETMHILYLKKGDVLKVTGNSTYQANYAIYGSY